MSIPDGYMMDAQGRLVPRENIKPQDLLEDELVRILHAKAGELTQALASFKKEGFSEVAALQELLHEQYQAKIGGAKGNTTLSSYDGHLRVSVCIGESISFGPELQVAKSLLDELFERWTDGANANLKIIVMEAFDVGKEGKLSATKILGLRRHNVSDPEWKRAMDAIQDSIRIDSTKAYLRLHVRETPAQSWQILPLDLAKA
ncbi:DUF3164 family protein [Acetobacter tropicalis]|uniref:Sulfate transporter n=1 Tax=Acetobacter tropicalis TaxID=104102 RepID=A0A094YGK0_9PROT|nr:DUF3164 family protein [Acetobacter tropicalis]KAA8387054.1 DUF3164 family protein [Acetobacter tropicalis]KAA8391399.1 DUF3164 family protein [Acetobacter tropicalis]KGB21155.1 hypothetical protein AtDm6_3150 [Acetobacter tropicalis]MBC9008777.1 DUF3164 family protein [Acetobacter tropicalis]MDO8171950.1 DUF3164 family protein [Acetobacter tropicalis]